MPKPLLSSIGIRNEGLTATPASVHLRPRARYSTYYAGPRNPYVERYLTSEAFSEWAEVKTLAMRTLAGAEFYYSSDTITRPPFNLALAASDLPHCPICTEIDFRSLIIEICAFCDHLELRDCERLLAPFIVVSQHSVVHFFHGDYLGCCSPFSGLEGILLNL